MRVDTYLPPIRAYIYAGMKAVLASFAFIFFCMLGCYGLIILSSAGVANKIFAENYIAVLFFIAFTTFLFLPLFYSMFHPKVFVKELKCDLFPELVLAEDSFPVVNIQWYQTRKKASLIKWVPNYTFTKELILKGFFDRKYVLFSTIGGEYEYVCETAYFINHLINKMKNGILNETIMFDKIQNGFTLFKLAQS